MQTLRILARAAGHAATLALLLGALWALLIVTP
jgi:hypothetical protein